MDSALIVALLVTGLLLAWLVIALVVAIILGRSASHAEDDAELASLGRAVRQADRDAALDRAPETRLAADATTPPAAAAPSFARRNKASGPPRARETG